MGKRIYKVSCAAIRLFSHRMKTIWETPFEEGPCVFVANQAGACGPADMCAKFPMKEKLHPWINSELLSAKEAPAFIGKNYRPQGAGAAVLKKTVPGITGRLFPPVLKGADYIPVYGDQRFILTLRNSIRVLQKNQCLLIFPEIPNTMHNGTVRITSGWLRLGELWYRSSGRALRIYPIHVDTKRHEFRVSAPVMYEPSKTFLEQEKNLADRLARGIAGAAD